ncbi:hypothetical protein TCAL_13143 [Tigriopus californicus]|uniref:Peroxidase n=1 Tax=Tigriopus californicus TaxID=6832 RepID=A0A553PS73_TIGCA|nr:myeloperoxidase-like [Tigriopus californicus]TRY80536.1 hypothetical protein TCAL_13143 [Tigriopus californicus]
MIKFGTVCALIVAFYGLANVAQSQNISFVVDRAIAQLAKELESRFIDGSAHSAAKSRSHKKTTPRSRSMDKFNSLVERSISLLTAESNLDTETARQAVSDELKSRALQGLDRNDNGLNALNQFNNLCFRETRERCNSRQWFRNINGQCNNLNNPLWGAAGSAFKRLVPSRYQDGRGVPVGGTLGGQKFFNNVPTFPQCLSNQPQNLPNPRLVSTVFHPDVNAPSNQVTHMVTQFGQFLDHDLTLTPEADIEHCCDTPSNPECFSIAVPRNDFFYSRVSRTCLDLSRSTAFCTNRNTQRQQFNEITAFLDGSNVYGSDDATARQLRFGNFNGQLFHSTTNNHVMLPQINGEFTAGDTRATEMPGLATMHTLFLREHNRITIQLKRINPRLDDENLYQRARAMVIAQMQHITYNEYLPVILGPTIVSNYGILSNNGFTNYNPSVNPSISNSFATAAYRFGHSMIQGLIQLVHETTRNVQESFQLKDEFFKLDKYFGNNGAGMQRLLNGLITQPAQSMDRFVVDDVTNFLFPEDGENFGSDLVARNIQRGRDHGLPGYNDYRQWCGMPISCNWNQRPAEISQGNWNQLRALYQNPWDIDLFVAGLAEQPFSGGITGRTFQCIKTKQFFDLKFGDRFFFTHSNQAGSFNFNQLRNIQSRSLADIICDNTQISVTKRNVFLLNSPDRPCFASNSLQMNLFAF